MLASRCLLNRLLVYLILISKIKVTFLFLIILFSG